MNDSKTLTAFALAFGPACLVPFALIGRGAGEGPESSFEVPSPSGDIAVEIVVADELTYSVTWRGRPLVTASPVSMTLEDGTVIGPDARVVDSRHRTVDEEISLVVPEKFARIRDHYELCRRRCVPVSHKCRRLDDRRRRGTHGDIRGESAGMVSHRGELPHSLGACVLAGRPQ